MIMKPQLTTIDVQYQYHGRWQSHSSLCWLDCMDQSVSSSRGEKLRSIHYSSQADWGFGNQFPGKWKRKTGPVQPGKKRVLKLFSPWQGLSSLVTAGLRVSSSSLLLLLAPLVRAYGFILSLANHLCDIFVRALPESAYFPLLSAQQSQGYSLSPDLCISKAL